MKKMMISLLLAAIAAAGLVIVATASLSADRTAPVHLTIRASEMQYAPAKLHLRAGVPVHLTLINDGKVLHDFNLKGSEKETMAGHEHHAAHGQTTAGQGSHVAVQPGQSAALHFTPAAGEIEFYCSVPGHREAGMTGKLLVH
jgi:uncharacterized cupredoxin-like copper-binding protein